MLLTRITVRQTGLIIAGGALARDDLSDAFRGAFRIAGWRLIRFYARENSMPAPASKVSDTFDATDDITFIFGIFQH